MEKLNLQTEKALDRDSILENDGIDNPHDLPVENKQSWTRFKKKTSKI